MQVSKGSLVHRLNLGGMVGTNGIETKVIGQGPGHALQFPDEQVPGVEQEGNQCHAQWAALGDAAWMAVRFAKSSSHSVVVKALSMKGSICLQRSRREASKLQESNEQLQLHLIKTFENVC